MDQLLQNAMKRFLLCLFFLSPLAIAAQKVYLIGDAGEPNDPDQNLMLLEEQIRTAQKDDILIFLGDNLYPKGMPELEHPARQEMEAKLIPQLELIKKFPGRSYLIPGDRDWAKGKKHGWERVRSMADFVQEDLGGDEFFFPQDGCPGPIEFAVNANFTIVLIDTQYFLHRWDKPGEASECNNKSTIEALDDLNEIIKRNRGKHILLAGHHPMFTYGPHHGNLSFKDQLKPIPVLGSLQPLFRRTIGGNQDNTNLRYRAVMKQILLSMKQAEHVIYASAHEHSLQLIEREGHHFIVSGSGSKTSHVKQGRYSKFAKSEKGFAVLDVAGSGEASVKFYGEEQDPLFKQQLYSKELKAPEEPKDVVTFSDSTVTRVASNKYTRKSKKNVWMGSNYRDVWSLPITFDVFDIGKERGGLKILKKGGGLQTLSLRMEAEDGRQYVLRSIEKYPEKALPPALRNTFAKDAIEDQISASHPYAAYIIPPLADAANIYHANPKPVFIPDDARFGQFRSTFGGILALYEERANRASAGDSHFGGGDDVDGTLTALENLRKDNDNSVDQEWVVRTRLFDMLIGDWDRHDDQWRWVQFDDDDRSVYRPIPRDRDQAFYINEGILPSIVSRKWAVPMGEGFNEDVRWSPGFNKSARFFDRSFMNELEWDDWEVAIAYLQSNVTNQVIEDAVGLWPDNVQELTGERVSRTLKARRKNMPGYARKLYEFLAREVEVVGSDKHEYFSVDHLSANETRVTVQKRRKDGTLEHTMFDRTFKSEETKEVRLYGLDGEDVFEVGGVSNPGIKVRIIGGTDRDLVKNQKGEERLRKLKVYDRLKSTEVVGNSKGILKLSDHPEINRYNRTDFKYDALLPIIILGANPDDGLFIGGGFNYTKNGWRKDPFASQHVFTAKRSLATDAFGVNYSATWTDVLGKWDLRPRLILEQPFGVNNYFGLGNETVFRKGQFQGDDENDIDFYRYQQERVEADADLVKNLGALGSLTVGTGFRSIKVRRNSDRFIGDDSVTGAGSAQVFNTNSYLKAKIGLSVDTRTNKIIPQDGILASAAIEHLEALTTHSQSVTRLSADWSFYLSFKLPSSVVIANRFGTAHNIGDYEFFNANILGGRTNLRGFRMTRFYGDTYFYHNIDLRLKLFSFRSYIFPGQFGILAFHDTGRVWIDGESSNTWHTGKGFGIWITPINQFVLNLNYGFGGDENIPSFYFGFFF